MEGFLKTFSLTEQDAFMIPVGVVLFITLWRFLAVWVFTPFIKLVEARELATTGATDTASDAIREASELQQKYDDEITVERVRLMKQKLERMADAKQKAGQIVSDAQSDAQNKVTAHRANLAKLKMEARHQALSEGDSLISSIVEKVTSLQAWIIGSVLMGFYLLCSNPAFASSSASGHGQHGEPVSLLTVVSSLSAYYIHFFLYLAVLYFAVRRPLKAFWLTRIDEIENSVKRGEAELAAATKKLKEAQQLLGAVPATIKKLQVDIEAETEREIASIFEEAKLRAQRIDHQAQLSIEAEKRGIENAIRLEVAEHVLAQAEERIKREFDEARDKPLRQKAVQNVRQLVVQ